MSSYYEATTRIRYYGQLPKSVRRELGPVRDEKLGKVQREVVVGEMEFTEEDRLIPIPSDQPMDLSRRREPVHEELANLVLDAASLYAFTKKWGFLEGEIGEIEAPSGLVWGEGWAGKGLFRSHPNHIQPLQDLLRRAWKGDGRAIEAMASDIRARVDVRPTGVEIAVLDLWNLIRLLFMRDYAVGRTKVCSNKDCLSPYFLEQRKGQKFCSHKCAVLINVRRFRERAAEHESRRKRRAAQ